MSSTYFAVIFILQTMSANSFKLWIAVRLWKLQQNNNKTIIIIQSPTTNSQLNPFIWECLQLAGPSLSYTPMAQIRSHIQACFISMSLLNTEFHHLPSCVVCPCSRSEVASPCHNLSNEALTCPLALRLSFLLFFHPMALCPLLSISDLCLSHSSPSPPCLWPLFP